MSIATSGDESLPLTVLLSRTLVAFIIEFDNEFERQTPHRTAANRGTKGWSGRPWLLSMVMWVRFLQFVPEPGISIADFAKRTKLTREELRRSLTRLSKWWGYLRISGSTPQAMIHWTPGGCRAREIWLPLTQVIESRWAERFGKDQLTRLSEALRHLVNRFPNEPPDCLPILGYGLWCKGGNRDDVGDVSLPALLSKALLQFAVEYESESHVSLAIGANVLRLIGDDGVRVRDLPALAGISKEAVAVAYKFLERRGFLAAVKPVLLLNERGRQAQEQYLNRVSALEQQWVERSGSEAIHNLRTALENLPVPMLLRGLEENKTGWRAQLPPRRVFPHFPVILHRGGYPDGS